MGGYAARSRRAATPRASGDPVVAEALGHRSSAVQHAAVQHAAVEAPVGWPGAPAPEGGGLGWPADTVDADSGSDSAPTKPEPPAGAHTRCRLPRLGRAA